MANAPVAMAHNLSSGRPGKGGLFFLFDYDPGSAAEVGFAFTHGRRRRA
jgi:hypothetical protein